MKAHPTLLFLPALEQAHETAALCDGVNWAYEGLQGLKL